MDVRMPGLDGISATRLIAALDAPRPVRVVILTTYDLDEYVFDALAAGASGFLLKDERPEDLVQGVRLVAAGDALLSPSVTRRLIAEFAKRGARRGQMTAWRPCSPNASIKCLNLWLGACPIRKSPPTSWSARTR